MIKTDLHVHTMFSDGIHSPEEYVLAAMEKGMEKIGFSDHSYTPFDESYCIKKDKTDEYIRTVNGLKEKYKGKIEILCGIEWDAFGEGDISAFDYTIGSVHYLLKDGIYYPVDESKEDFDRLCSAFGGAMNAVREYYRNVKRLVEKVKPTIVGHFDLIAKFNEKNEFFDENSDEYFDAFKECADTIIKYKVPVEINTGAVSRGYRTAPYPSGRALEYLKTRGASFVFSSDSHRKETLLFGFEEWKEKYGL